VCSGMCVVACMVRVSGSMGVVCVCLCCGVE